MSFTRLAGLLGFLGVALGAFGAHGLKDRLDDVGRELWRTAVLYHLLHALALLVVALARQRFRFATATCWLFAAGVLVFSGTLYGLALGGARWLGAITPAGGAALLAGWLVLGAGGTREP